MKTPEITTKTTTGGITQPPPKKKTTRVKKEVSEIETPAELKVPDLSEEEAKILNTLERTGYFEATDTEGETEVENTDTLGSDGE